MLEIQTFQVTNVECDKHVCYNVSWCTCSLLFSIDIEWSLFINWSISIFLYFCF